MPGFVNDEHNRETQVLDAPWWAHQPDGTPIETVTVYAQMIEADNQWIQRQLLGKVKLGRSTGGGRGGRGGQDIDMAEYARSRFVTLLRMIVAMTDQKGNPVPVTPQQIVRMHERDAEWIAAQLNEMNEAPVVPTEEDMATAEAKDLDPFEVAEAAFR